MADLKNYKIYKNDKYQVLTQDGFKDFKGLIKGNNENKIILHIYQKSLICTPKHKIMIDGDNYVYAKDLKVGDKIYGGVSIIDIVLETNDGFVYEFLEISDTHTYFSNGFLNRQCLLVDEMSFVEPNIMEAFWSAVYPTISSSKKAKILIASTPNGVGNLFHTLWEKAISGENSGWGNIMVKWSDLPGKDEEWARQERLTLGDDKFDQEYDCKFLESGESVLPEDLYNDLQRSCIKPRMTFEGETYKVFKEPDIENRIYCAGVDIGEGVGECNSTINIMDITELTNVEQVATYASNDVGPHEFARIVNEIMKQWGKPPLAVERNNSGGGVVISQLEKEYNYPNLLNFSIKQGRIDYGHLKGVTSSTNTKYHGVMNMFYWLKSHRRVILHDIDTLKELNTFVRHKNEKWGRKSASYKDDRVDALIWSLICIHEMAVTQFYSVIVKDDNNKPFQIEPLYAPYGTKDSKYRIGDEENNWGVDALLMPGISDDPFMDELNSMGWTNIGDENQSNWSSYEPISY